MKTARLIFVICFMIGYSVFAQQTGKPGMTKNGFHSFNTVSILNGSSTTSVALNTVNGLQLSQHLFTGIGVGFDYYYHTSIPVFGEIRYDLLQGNGRLQLVGNAGINFPFSKQGEKFNTKIGPYKSGAIYGAGIDYVVPVKMQALILGVSFNSKHLTQMVDNYIWDLELNNIENIPIKDKYSLNRIAIKIGWMF
ncbi:hypothetical protein BH11BAC3_BH11BAC3_47710 [soil metagenome]